MKKLILRSAGCAAVGLGVAGAFLPLLPTTPFLLLAAWCFARSSPRLSEWLLSNKFCGSYIRDYQQGGGIPSGVKAAAILMVWGGISFSAIVFVEAWWIRGILYLIAVGVSLHILSIRPRRKAILVFAPTEAEIAPFRALNHPGVRIIISGVGTINTLLALENALSSCAKPRRVILAGIAGAYPDSGLQTGEAVAVSEEFDASAGSFSEGVFSAKFARRYPCPELPASLPAVSSNTVSAAAAPYLPQTETRIENMEGAAFFAGCLSRGIPFWEIRTVSNRVGEPFENWDIPLAAQNLATALTLVIDEIDA